MLSLGFCLSVFYLVILVHVSSSFFNFICLSFFPLLGGTGPDLKFVATVATGGRVNFFQLCKFFQKITHFSAKFGRKFEFSSVVW